MKTLIIGAFIQYQKIQGLFALVKIFGVCASCEMQMWTRLAVSSYVPELFVPLSLNAGIIFSDAYDRKWEYSHRYC